MMSKIESIPVISYIVLNEHTCYYEEHFSFEQAELCLYELRKKHPESEFNLYAKVDA